MIRISLHAAQCPGRTSRNSGRTRLQPSTAIAQRGWNTQPEGGLIGLGTSPLTGRNARVSSTVGSGTGTADSKRLGIGVERVVEQLVALGQFDDAAEIHDRDPLAQMPHHRKIMGDEQIGQAKAVRADPRAG